MNRTRRYQEKLYRLFSGRPLTPSGKRRFVGRFLNFLNRGDVTPPAKVSWRGGGADIRLDYSVYYVGATSPANADSLGPDLIPFAGVDTRGHDCRAMSACDMLCLRIQQDREPDVVIWSVGESRPDDPAVEFVANTFTEFLMSLRRCPASLVEAHAATLSEW